MRLGPANRTAAFVPQAGADNSHGTVDRPTAAEFNGNQKNFPFGPAPEAAMGSHIEDQQTALVGLCRGGGGHGSASCCARNSVLAGKTGVGGNQAPAWASNGWLQFALTPVGRENFSVGVPDTQVAGQSLWVYLSSPGCSRSVSFWLQPTLRHSPKVLDARES